MITQEVVSQLSEIDQILKIEYDDTLIFKTSKSIYDKYYTDLIGGKLEPRQPEILTLKE